MLFMNTVLEIEDLDPKLQIWANLVPALKFAPIFMKFGTQDTIDMLITDTLRWIENLDLKKKI